MTETKKQYKLVLDGVDLVPQERGKKPMPFDSYKCFGGIEIMSFHTDESHHIEDIIFNYYDKNKYSLKHKSDTYFLLIDDQPRGKFYFS